MKSLIEKLLNCLRAGIGARHICSVPGSRIEKYSGLALRAVSTALAFIEDYCTPKDEFTHFASFYGVPCYYNEETEMLAGRTCASEYLLTFVTICHNEIVERAVQFLAANFYIDYEPGFRLKIWEFEQR